MPLTEISAAPDTTDGTRRWFQGDDLELVVWSDEGGVRQYQLRYTRDGEDGVFEWRRPGRVYHYRLDDGEGRAARVDASPVLTPDGPGDPEWVLARFRAESAELPAVLRDLVEGSLASPAG